MDSGNGRPGQADAANGIRAPEVADSRPLREPVRLAWIVTLAAFALFCLICAVAVSSAVFAYRNADVRGELLLQPAFGTIYLNSRGSSDTLAVTESLSGLAEGSVLRTQRESTQGVLGLFAARASGGMLNSVQMSSNTTLEVIRARRPRFPRNGRPHEVHLRLHAGQVRVVTLMPEKLQVEMRIDTPHGRVDLADGVTRIHVDGAQTEVDAIDSAAQVANQAGTARTLAEGQRLAFTREAIAAQPSALAADILVNGSFQAPLAPPWATRIVANDVPPPTMHREFKDGRWVAHFRRQVGDNAHNQFELRQRLDRNVGLNESLILRLNLRIDFQSLPGAGDLSSEFPMRVEIGYTDIYGQERTWGRGFFYLDPLPHYWIENGEQIPEGTWFAYESPNLFSLLTLTRPEIVNYVRIHASGHDYDSYVSRIALITQ